MVQPAKRRVIGDTPEHGKYLIEDSGTGVTAECNGGLAFALGVATLEAETCREDNRMWSVKHPNGAILYIVKFSLIQSQTITTKVC